MWVLGRPGRRWEESIKMDLEEIEGGGGGTDRFDLAEDRDS